MTADIKDLGLYILIVKRLQDLLPDGELLIDLWCIEYIYQWKKDHYLQSPTSRFSSGSIAPSLSTSEMCLQVNTDLFLPHNSLLAMQAAKEHVAGCPVKGKIKSRTNVKTQTSTQHNLKTTSTSTDVHIWLESPRKYIPISRMSPNHAHSRASPGLNFSRNCTGPFTSF